MLSNKDKLFINLLSLGIGTVDVKESKPLFMLTMSQWRNLMAMAEKQGVAAIAIDGVQRLYDTYGKDIKAVSETPAEWKQWAFECAGLVTQYEQMCLKQRKVIYELSDIWAKESIRMMVFKGQANAFFYPKPEHRTTGDIDCWLFGEAEKGDSLLENAGTVVDNKWYRHSKISFKGETIENHRVFCHTRGNRKKKAMEEELKAMLRIPDFPTLEDCGKAFMPPAQFNACFLTYHGLHHFLSEGLRMKQVLDWAIFLKAAQKDVDWNAYNDFCEKYYLEIFSAVMNHIAIHYLGVELKCQGIITDDTYAEKVIISTLNDDDYLFNSGKSDWKVRWLLVKNMLRKDRWKYREIAQDNVWKRLYDIFMGFLKDKD